MQSHKDRLRTFDEAYSLIMEAAYNHKLASEGVAIKALLGRVLAEDLLAPNDVPAAPNSAMDGYCVRHSDIARATPDYPVILPILGHSDAGHPLAELMPGHAAYIATGGLLPKGADTVVKIEDIELLHDPERVVIKSPPPIGAFVRQRGKDMQAGCVVLSRGQLMGPFEVGIAASLGRVGVLVSKRPKVAIITSGDELVMPFEEPQPWQVRNSNSTLLCAAIEELGGEPIDLGIVRDDPERAVAALERAAELGDIIVTSGGISMGRKDPFTTAIKMLKVDEIVHGVAIKPGKPLFFGLFKGKPIFGLPGNQASTAVTFQLFVRPFMARMQGCRFPDLPTINIQINTTIENHTGRDHFLRGCLRSNNSGVTYADPFSHQDSHLITSLAGAEILIRHPANQPIIEKGSYVTCLIIRIR